MKHELVYEAIITAVKKNWRVYQLKPYKTLLNLIFFFLGHDLSYRKGHDDNPLLQIVFHGKESTHKKVSR